MMRGVTFGDWRLVRRDSLNWELQRRQATKDTSLTRKNGTAGSVRWHSVGKFYQWNTFHNAVMYAADCEMGDEADERRMELHEFASEYEERVRAFADELRRGLMEVRDK